MAVTTQVEIKQIAEWAATIVDRRHGRARLDADGQRLARRERGQRRVPGRRPVSAGRPDASPSRPAARRAAADVIVVNTHLYGLDVASGGAILPEHDVVVFDEAHVLEDIMSDTVGVEIAPGRFIALSGAVRRILDDPQLIGSIAELAEALRDALAGIVGTRLSIPLPDSIQELLDRRPVATRLDERRAASAIDHRRRRRQAAQAPGADDDRPGDRAVGHRDRGT